MLCFVVAVLMLIGFVILALSCVLLLRCVVSLVFCCCRCVVGLLLCLLLFLVLPLLLLSCWLVRVVTVGVLLLTVLLDDVVGLLELFNVVLCFVCVVCGIIVVTWLWLICL